jgi:hypothetical protein
MKEKNAYPSQLRTCQKLNAKLVTKYLWNYMYSALGCPFCQYRALLEGWTVGARELEFGM